MNRTASGVTAETGSGGSRVAGIAVAAAGLLLVLAGLGLGHAYLFEGDRILVLKPEMADAVALDVLVSAAPAHDGRRVRVRGELWRIAPSSAVLVPTGSGPERLGIDELVALLKDPANAKRPVPQVRALPATHLALVCSAGGGRKTLSFYEAAEAAQGGTVEVAGRFLSAGGPGGAPALDAAAMVEPSQPEFHAPVVLFVGVFAAVPVIGLILLLLGIVLARRGPRAKAGGRPEGGPTP
jgi:hypothetical protein